MEIECSVGRSLRWRSPALRRMAYYIGSLVVLLIREVADTHTIRKQALQFAHDGAGHRAIEGTFTILASRFWFPLMDKFVCRHIARCVSYQRYARAGPVQWFPNYTVAVLDIFAHWGIDFACPFPIDQCGFQYICLAVDSLMRWAEIRPSKTATAADAANFIYHDIICRFGLPKSIQSDNGSRFANEVIQRLTQILEIRHRISTSYYPESNERAERLIGTLKSMMVQSVQYTEMKKPVWLIFNPRFILYFTFIVLLRTMLRVFLQHT
jgi:hypothetical protein